MPQLDVSRQIKLAPSVPDSELEQQVITAAEFIGCRPIDILRLSLEVYCAWLLQNTAPPQEYDIHCRTVEFPIMIPKQIRDELKEAGKIALIKKRCQSFILAEAAKIGLKIEDAQEPSRTGDGGEASRNG